MKKIYYFLTLLIFSFTIFSQETTNEESVDSIEEVVAVGTRATVSYTHLTLPTTYTV